MTKKILTCILVIAIVLVAGCGSKVPDIDINVKWEGVKGLVPYVSNDMRTTDNRNINVIIENNDKLILEGIILRANSNIPNFIITPDNVTVMSLGPEGSSKTEPSIFIIETINTPPGKYSFWILAEYDGDIIKRKQVDVDIG
jgi:hypothetical protein